MPDSLRWAHRWRLELAIEIEQLESGVLKVTHNTARGAVDVTQQTLDALKDRFVHLEEMIAAISRINADED